MKIDSKKVEHFHITQNAGGGGVLKVNVGSLIVSVADFDSERNFYELIIYSSKSGDQLTEAKTVSCFSDITTAVKRAQLMQKN